MKNLDQGPGFDFKQLLLFYFAIVYFLLLLFEHNHTPSGKKTVTGMHVVTTSQVGAGRRPFCPAHNRWCVCVAVTTLSQSSSLPKSACRVVLNVPVGMLIVIVVSHAAKASWVVVMYTMNNHTYNAMRVCDSRTYKTLYLSCLGAKDITQSLWETLVSLLIKWCCHKKCCGRVGCAAV